EEHEKLPVLGKQVDSVHRDNVAVILLDPTCFYCGHVSRMFGGLRGRDWSNGVMEYWSNGLIHAFKPNAPTLPYSNTPFRSCRGLPCRAASLYQLSLAPLLPDALALRFGLLDGIFWAQHALGGLGEHDVEDPFLVSLVNRRVG